MSWIDYLSSCLNAFSATVILKQFLYSAWCHVDGISFAWIVSCGVIYTFTIHVGLLLRNIEGKGSNMRTMIPLIIDNSIENAFYWIDGGHQATKEWVSLKAMLIASIVYNSIPARLLLVVVIGPSSAGIIKVDVCVQWQGTMPACFVCNTMTISWCQVHPIIQFWYGICVHFKSFDVFVDMLQVYSTYALMTRLSQVVPRMLL